MRSRVLEILAAPQTAQRTIEWHLERAAMLTASDVARSVGDMGDAERRKLVELKRRILADPTCVGEEEVRNPVLQYGVDGEDGVREALEGVLGVRIHEVGLIRHAHLPWLGASVDGITDNGIVIELKKPYSRKIVPGEIPYHYFCQVQMQLECLDLELAYYAEMSETWPCERVLNIVPIVRDRAWFASNLPKMEKFMSEVRSGAPAPRRTSTKRKRRESMFIDGMYDSHRSFAHFAYTSV